MRKFYTPSPKTKQIINKEKLFNCNNYDPIKIAIVKAKGPYVYDVDNIRYLDCIAAYSSLN